METDAIVSVSVTMTFILKHTLVDYQSPDFSPSFEGLSINWLTKYLETQISCGLLA